MATAQDVQNSERLLDLSNQLIDSINERKKALKGINAEEQLYLSSIKQQQKLSQDITANAENYLRYAVKSKDLNKQIDAAKKQQKKSEDAFATIEQKLIDTRRKATIESRNINTSIIKQKQELFASEQRRADLETRKQIAISQGDIQSAQYLQDRIKDEAATARIKLSEIDSLQKQLDKEIKLRDSAKETLKSEEKAKKTRKEELEFLEKNLEIRKRIEKSTGLLGAFSKGLSKIPGIGQYLNADEAIEEMEKLGAEIEDAGGRSTSFGNRLKIGLKGASTLAKGFYENIKSPEAVFTFIVTQAFKANEQAVKLGKALGYGVDRANALRQDFAFMSSTAFNTNVNVESLVKAFEELAEATGYMAEYSADALETQVMLTKQLGLSAEEAAGIYKLSVLTGKTSSEVNDNMVGAFVAARNQYKVGVSLKAVMAEASKVTGQLSANLQNNPELITKAIIQAKALGTTLEQTAKQGSALLDFESSIENELKAELLTGKQLNLERARAAALAGDQISLAEELNKNIGTLEDFQKMNVLQQKALAEAVGLTADELSDQLRKQKMAQESGKSLAEITKEEALQAEKRQAAQEKFANLITKLTDLVANLVSGPFGQLLDLISNIATILVNVIGPIFGFIGKAIDYMVEGLKVVGVVLGTIAAGLVILNLKTFAGAALAIVKGAWNAFGGLPVIGPPLAIATSLAAIGAIKKYTMDDGVIGPGGQPIVSGPKGSIQLNKDDSLIAGTNLFGGKKSEGTSIPQINPPSDSLRGKKSEETSMPQIDLTPMIAAINEVRTAIDRLYGKDQSINMDGKKVGNTLVQGSYKVA
jgi:hypothetical protein